MAEFHPDESPRRNWFSNAALLLGPAIFLAVVMFADLAPGRPAVTRTAAVALLMAIWWITEAIPLPVTALLPVALFPLLGVMDGKAVASQYFNHIIFLFVGGFLVALAMERWDLHKRIAINILLLFGGGTLRVLLGFMVATWFLSMWISNTAAAMMVVAIAMAVISQMEAVAGAERTRGLSTGLLLGVAYGASIGGIATLVGTPPNMSFSRIFELQFPAAPEISFATWFGFAMPISVALLLITWCVLSVMHVRHSKGVTISKELLAREREKLGRISFPEAVVFVAFLLLVVLWLFRSDIVIGGRVLPGWSRLFDEPKFITDGTVAILVALALFLIPSGRATPARIMDWAGAAKLPWNIVLLFGGGFALAAGFVESGLSDWVGDQMVEARFLDPYALVALLCLTMTFMTELTSNTATTEMILPLLAGLATGIGANPLLLMVPVTISCSCAFMMPVATPPNAIVFGTQRLRIADMAKTGLVLNLIGAVVIVLAMYLRGESFWGIEPGQLPTWAVRP